MGMRFLSIENFEISREAGMMKILSSIGVCLLALTFIIIPVEAYTADVLTLRLETGGGSMVEVEDNATEDDSGEIGVVTFSGSLGNFSTIVATVISKPIVGALDQAELGLSVVSTTSDAGDTLYVSASDLNYLVYPDSGTGSFISAVGGTTGGSTIFQTFLDADNVLFAVAGLSICPSGIQGPFSGAFDDTITNDCYINGEFSITATAEATLGPRSVQSFGATYQFTAPEETEGIGCRFTGGGVDTDLNWDHTLEDGETIRNGAGNIPEGIDRYQFGGQVGARTAQDPDESGEWQHHQQEGPSGSFSFHGGSSSAAEGTRIVDIRCSDPGYCFPARPAPAKQLDFDGIGTFSNLGKGKNAPIFEIPGPNVIPEPNKNKDNPFSFHWFEVNIDDLGEPGRLNSGQPNSEICPGRGFGEKSAGPYDPTPLDPGDDDLLLDYTELANCDCPDFYRITIYRGVLSTEVTFLEDGKVDPASLNKSDVIYEAFGYIDGGNLQIHPPTGYDLQ
ncbi:MAG: hypothetical protein JXR49_09940 [Acidobacteria bacterium]|nr:hypothetical protein [Acidobacteriota bacterium]